MIDREKVIRAIEACMYQNHPACCNECYLGGPGFGIACREKLMRDALVLLREQEAPQWISVKDRLPEPPAQCLVYSAKASRPRGMETATYTGWGWMTAAYFPGITHWMPLPDQPEEDDE